MAEKETSAPVAGTLGIERWVQFAFIVAALITFWLLDKLVGAGWDFFADPDPRVITPVSAVGAILVAAGLYRSPKVHQFSHEVAGELSKVTWPSRQETWQQTVVVIVVSLIAAVVLGVFDAVWSGLSDLIYHA